MNDNIINWQNKIIKFEKLTCQLDKVVASCENLSNNLKNCKNNLDENSVVSNKTYDDGILVLDIESCEKIKSAAIQSNQICNTRIQELRRKIDEEKIRLEKARAISYNFSKKSSVSNNITYPRGYRNDRFNR